MHLQVCHSVLAAAVRVLSRSADISPVKHIHKREIMLKSDPHFKCVWLYVLGYVSLSLYLRIRLLKRQGDK